MAIRVLDAPIFLMLYELQFLIPGDLTAILNGILFGVKMLGDPSS